MTTNGEKNPLAGRIAVEKAVLPVFGRDAVKDENPVVADQITVEQLLLAAAVLSAQNPQGANLDRKKLLAEAHEFALQAREVAFMTTFQENLRNDRWRKSFFKCGYDQLQKFVFVPYGEAAREVTGLKTKKQAILRFEKFLTENMHSDLMVIVNVAPRLGIWRDLIPELRRREKEHFNFRNRQQKRANAQRPRNFQKTV